MQQAVPFDPLACNTHEQRSISMTSTIPRDLFKPGPAIHCVIEGHDNRIILHKEQYGSLGIILETLMSHLGVELSLDPRIIGLRLFVRGLNGRGSYMEVLDDERCLDDATDIGVVNGWEYEEEREISDTEDDNSETDNYDSMKVVDLKVILKSRSLPVSGKKAALIARLRDSDSNSNSPTTVDHKGARNNSQLAGHMPHPVIPTKRASNNSSADTDSELSDLPSDFEVEGSRKKRRNVGRKTLPPLTTGTTTAPPPRSRRSPLNPSRLDKTYNKDTSWLNWAMFRMIYL
ncbi:hypothetical protein BJ508DRAFT_316402 [Ascobolus immersus RN42]|uniref:SAP domain-containing protein n=1 Tax=Ascobolus immersus RN42 TaxID=1160509 RepID=A0A3N4HBG2_ASCIM|nr:hypothetical protein BJ508DRAFT_316402 [Ascobolus immersus RN42]